MAHDQLSRRVRWERRLLIAAAVALVVVGLTAGGVVKIKIRHAPFGPDAVAADVQLDTHVAEPPYFSDWQRRVPADSAVHDLAIEYLGLHAPYAIGTVSVHAPALAPGNYWELLFIDKRRGALMTPFEAGPEQAVTIGWQGAREADLARVPWLARYGGGGMFAGSGFDLSFPPDTQVGFILAAPAVAYSDGETSRELTASPRAPDDVLIALMLVGRDGHIYWAKRIHG